MMNTLLLIDGNAIMHRAFHALPPFKTKSGVPTHVIYGFFSMLYKAVTDFAPTQVAVCFDTPKPTFRNKLYKEYQSHRPKMADEFAIQIPILKEGLTKAGILSLEKEGYEADDLIGTIAKKVKSDQNKVIILTGDRDILQLVDKNVFVASPTFGLSNIKMYDEAEVQRKYDLPASKIPDLKALMGDPSDNYPGAKGIGPKTAAKLLKEYHTVENLLDHADELDEKTKTILMQCKSDVEISKQLAKIDTNVPVQFDIGRKGFAGFDKKLKDFLMEYEMKSLATRFFEVKPAKKQTKESPKKESDQIELF